MSGHEVVRTQSTEIVAAEQGIVPAWERPGTGLSRDLAGVHLGVLVDSEGWNAGYHDKHEEPLTDLGVIIGVSQSGAGDTGLFAKNLEGFIVEALNPEASSKKTMWRGTSETSEEVSVDYDSGRLGMDRAKDRLGGWVSEFYGTPGTRFGIVRVTDPEQSVRHFAVGATFKGREDDWWVSAKIVEVFPTEQKQLPASAIKQLGSGAVEQSASDPSLIKGNIVDGMRIDSTTIQDLQTAFEHETPDIWFLHAADRSIPAVKKFGDVALDLLIETAKSGPQLMDGTEELVDTLGYFAGWIAGRTGTNHDGYVQSLDDENAARVTYLENVKELVGRYAPDTDTAHRHNSLAQKAFEILQQAFDKGRGFQIERSSALGGMLTEVITVDQEQTAHIFAERQAVLAETIMNPNWEKRGVLYRAAIPGQKVEIDLSNYTALLSDEQTYHAFYFDNRTDTRSMRTEGYYQPTIAMLEIGGERYALIDTRKPRGFIGNARSSKTGNVYSKGERSAGQFMLLQIANWQEDPRYGLEIQESSLSFARGSSAIQPIRNPKERDERGYLNDKANTGVTIEYDAETNRLTLLSTYRKVGVTAAASTFNVVRTEQGDTASLEERKAIREWQDAVKAVEQETERFRDQLERDFSYALVHGNMTVAEAEKRRADLEAMIARGPTRSRTHNGYPGSKYHRSQNYRVTVDAEGNIWGDFEHGRADYSVTGQPLAAGRYLLHRNPNLPQKQLPGHDRPQLEQ